MHKWILLSLSAVMILGPVAAQVTVDAGVSTTDASLDTNINSSDPGETDALVDASIATGNQTDARLATRGEMLQADAAVHRHIGLTISSAGITDYRAGKAAFFAGIEVGDLAAQASGNRIDGTFPGGRLQVTDAATAGLRIDADRAMDASIRLAPETSAQVESERLVWLQADGRSGALAILGNGSIAVEATSLTIQLAPGSTLRFEAKEGPRLDWQAEQRSFADGRLGAEVSIMGEVMSDEYTVHVSDVRTDNGSVAFTVDSELEHARVVSVAMDSTWLAADAEMRFDGQTAKRVANASAVHAAADSSVAVYSLLEVDGVLHATVHVPGFSAHDIEFAPASRHPPGEGAPGAGFVSVGCIVALVGIVRRLRN